MVRNTALDCLSSLVIGRDRETSRRFTILALGIGVGLFLAISVFRKVFGRIPPNWHLAGNPALEIDPEPTVLFLLFGLALYHAYKNDGLLVSLALLYFPMFSAQTLNKFSLAPSIHPPPPPPTFLEKYLFQPLEASLIILPVGGAAFILGVILSRLTSHISKLAS